MNLSALMLVKKLMERLTRGQRGGDARDATGWY
jgi:hypothetical protein